MRRNGTCDQQIHAHGWQISTSVAIGSLEESRYLASRRESSDRSLYRVVSDYGAGTSRMVVDEARVTSDLTRRDQRSTRDGCFVIPEGMFHPSIPTASESATIVATELSSRPSYVVAPRLHGSRILSDRRPVANMHERSLMFDRLHDQRSGDDWASFAFIVDETAATYLLVRSVRRPEL